MPYRIRSQPPWPDAGLLQPPPSGDPWRDWMAMQVARLTTSVQHLQHQVDMLTDEQLRRDVPTTAPSTPTPPSAPPTVLGLVHTLLVSRGDMFWLVLAAGMFALIWTGRLTEATFLALGK